MAGSSFPILLDVDTGVDDALALALAVELDANLVGVTTVAGNVPVDVATRNTIDVLSYLGATSTSVHRGASRPLIAPYQDALHVHGGNGLGGAQLPAGRGQQSATAGPAAIIRAAESYAGDLTIVTLGPLTNLAIALNVRPEVLSQIKRLVVMGGAFFVPGNVTSHAEFNVYVDPDAADQVFSAGFRDIRLIGLDVTHQTALTRDVWERIGPGEPGGAGLIRQTLARTFIERGMDGFFLHDPLALAVAIHPELVRTEPHQVTVISGGQERGRTIAVPNTTGPRVATSVDAEKFVSMLMRTLHLKGTPTMSGVMYVE